MDARFTPPDFSDLERVARALEAACPGAAPVAPLRLLGEGYFSVAVATASGYVVRLGTSPDVFERYRKEWRLLPWLAARGLPVAIPAPRWLLEPSPEVPCGGIAYPLLEGRTLSNEGLERGDRARLARDIAGFNLALHRIPLEDVSHLGIDGAWTHRRWMERNHEVSREVLPALLTAKEYAALERWWDGILADERLRQHPVRLIHGDIGDENLLTDEDGTRLVGVLDFEHAGLDDPLFDFDNLRWLGEDFRGEVIEAYRALGGALDADLEYRMRRHQQAGAFHGIRRAWLRHEPITREDVLARFAEYGLEEVIR